VRLAEKPKREFASRCSDVRSNSSGALSLRFLFSSLTIVPSVPLTASTTACACAAVRIRGPLPSAPPAATW
jgi:hypothetical protein